MLFVLDLDDTLYLERDFVKSGYQAVDVFLAKEKSFHGFFEFAWNEFVKGNTLYVINRFLEKKQCSSMNLLQCAIDIYRNHNPSICLLPDAIEFFSKNLPENCALITDGYAQTQWNKINTLGLHEKIKKIVVTGEWGKEYWKPHPRAYFEVQQDRPAGQCVYIADNPQKDFRSPTALKWHKSFRIRRRGALHYHLPTNDIADEIRSLSELSLYFE